MRVDDSVRYEGADFVVELVRGDCALIHRAVTRNDLRVIKLKDFKLNTVDSYSRWEEV